MFVLIYIIIFMCYDKQCFQNYRYNYYLRGKCLSINNIVQKYALHLKHAIINIIYTMVALY